MAKRLFGLWSINTQDNYAASETESGSSLNRSLVCMKSSAALVETELNPYGYNTRGNYVMTMFVLMLYNNTMSQTNVLLLEKFSRSCSTAVQNQRITIA